MPTKINRLELAKEFNVSLKNPVLGFFNAYRFLSNFWPCKVIYEGVEYPSSEHAYMAQKTLDLELREKIRLCKEPRDAKRLGRKIKLRADWEDVKVDIMFQVLKAKFFQNPQLKEWLLATGDRYLEETNSWNDIFWGVNAITLEGKNTLGQLLMLLRSMLNGNLLSSIE